jgi:hypothetical protein
MMAPGGGREGKKMVPHTLAKSEPNVGHGPLLPLRRRQLFLLPSGQLLMAGCSFISWAVVAGPLYCIYVPDTYVRTASGACGFAVGTNEEIDLDRVNIFCDFRVFRYLDSLHSLEVWNRAPRSRNMRPHSRYSRCLTPPLPSTSGDAGSSCCFRGFFAQLPRGLPSSLPTSKKLSPFPQSIFECIVAQQNWWCRNIVRKVYDMP